jgi:hypothetical protein
MPISPKVKLRTDLKKIIEKVVGLQQATAKVNDAAMKGGNAMVLPQPHHFDKVIAGLNEMDRILAS